MQKSFYDDIEFSYLDYWKGRQYEHKSEIVALSSLLGTTTYGVIADIGGGFGRITKLLAKYAKQTILVEPALKQRAIAKEHLKGISGVIIKAGTAEKTNLSDQSVDVAVLVRVMHHLPNPDPALSEVHRILKNDGLAIIEFANSLNLKSRIMSLLSGKPILPAPIDRRRLVNIRKNTIPFVNHHPISFQKTLARNGFKVEKILSVSNFRGLPIRSLRLEKMFQTLLAKLFFGPSIFILAKKTNL